MPLNPKDFPTTRAMELIAEEAERLRVLDVDAAVAYLAGKGEPNVFSPRKPAAKAKLVKYRRSR